MESRNVTGSRRNRSVTERNSSVTERKVVAIVVEIYVLCSRCVVRLVAAKACCALGRFAFLSGEGRFIGSQYPFVFVIGCLSWCVEAIFIY